MTIYEFLTIHNFKVILYYLNSRKDKIVLSEKSVIENFNDAVKNICQVE